MLTISRGLSCLDNRPRDQRTSGLNASTNFAELIAQSRASETAQPSRTTHEADTTLEEVAAPAEELAMWLRAFGSYFNPRYHPFTESERAGILERDFANETHTTQSILLRCSKLIATLTQPQWAVAPFYERDHDEVSANLPEEYESDSVEGRDSSLTFSPLTETFGDLQVICSALLNTPRVGFRTWTSLGAIIERDISRSDVAPQLTRTARDVNKAKLPSVLREITEKVEPEALSSDLLSVFFGLTELLEHLRFIKSLLQRDQPLKQTLPIFILVHEDTRNLLDLFETRCLRAKGLPEATVSALDGSAYAIAMEMRKAFEHELVGLSGAQQAPAIYAKVENAHGVLRDCFQQSLISLAQVFESTLDGTRIFRAFQTKLDQSLTLRRDLWVLLQHVQRAEKERDRRPVAPLVERLIAFREGSLRYLMYKDWESYERFLEEVAAARGAVELAPVLHRFGAYLETLFGQINMRAVFSAHPFDYPAINP